LYQSAYGTVLALRFAVVGQTGNESTNEAQESKKSKTDPKAVLGTKKGVPAQIAIHLAFRAALPEKKLGKRTHTCKVVADMIRYTATHAS
jgi:hypothetical protein